MNASFVLLFLSLVSLSFSSHCPGTETEFIRQDCSLFTEEDCQNGGCCWDPVNPDPTNLPWCFFPNSSTYQTCQPSVSRVDCAPGIPVNESSCLDKGCCWDPVNPNPKNLPWCYNTVQHPRPSPTTVPFSQTEIDTFFNYFLANLDYEGTGAVVAAPDNDTAAGSYIYHWMRDGGLSMRALLFVSTDKTLVDNYMQKWVQWELQLQNEADPNDIDIRIDPKYNLPSGTPNTDPWCRPQTDGPGIRGGTLADYALDLLTRGGDSYVKQYLWTGNPQVENGGAVKYDLDWVAANWTQFGCDLWEDFQSDDFFWNRINFRYSLLVGAELADKMGDSATADNYRQVAKDIEPTLLNHYNGQYLTETEGRPMDSAVINGIALSYLKDGFLSPTDYRVVNTVQVLTNLFETTFPINRYDALKGFGGILFGRYDGDVYAGGNPWILSSAALAQLYYMTASITLDEMTLPSPQTWSAYRKLLSFPSLSEKTSPVEFAESAIETGDNILYRIKSHTFPDDLHMSEQLDKVSGDQVNAHDLTWSYACVLKALASRDIAVKSFQTFN